MLAKQLTWKYRLVYPLEVGTDFVSLQKNENEKQRVDDEKQERRFCRAARFALGVDPLGVGHATPLH